MAFLDSIVLKCGLVSAVWLFCCGSALAEGGPLGALDIGGVDVSASYTNNLAGNPAGGVRQGFAYADSIEFGVEIDFGEIAGWHGLTLSAGAFDRNGRSLSDDAIGNVFTVQQVYGGQTFSFYTLFLEQEFADGKAALKAGRFSAGDDFATSDLYELYMNYGIDSNPQTLGLNPAFTTSPEAVWGATARVEPVSGWSALAGVFQTTAIDLYAGHGFDWAMGGGDGVLLIAQGAWSPVIGRSRADGGLPGRYGFGGFASTGQGGPEPAAATHGFYWQAEQMVFREGKSDGEGMTVWAVAVLMEPMGSEEVPFQVNAGIVYTGLIPGREEDVAMVGVASGRIGDVENGFPSGGGWECVMEFGYRIQLPGEAFVQPNLQWVLQPGGRGEIPNALVLGAQMGISF